MARTNQVGAERGSVAAGPQKVGALLAAVAIAVLWATANGSRVRSVSASLAIALASVAVVALLAYSFVISTLTYEVVEFTGQSGFPQAKGCRRVLAHTKRALYVRSRAQRHDTGHPRRKSVRRRPRVDTPLAGAREARLRPVLPRIDGVRNDRDRKRRLDRRSHSRLTCSLATNTGESTSARAFRQKSNRWPQRTSTPRARRPIRPRGARQPRLQLCVLAISSI